MIIFLTNLISDTSSHHFSGDLLIEVKSFLVLQRSSQVVFRFLTGSSNGSLAENNIYK